ncbi:MAG TPA: hypothetical protein VNL92_00460, partial [Dehalococcoidia bacterium]|nr:hypothetical protein [Dehalococcoidia bacterium]
MTDRPSIADIDRLLETLPPESRTLFDRLFLVDVAYGETDPPAEMHQWVREQFGGVEDVRRQKVVKITNRATLQGAVFNDLRSRRPQHLEDPPSIDDELAATDDPLARPEQMTSADTFGRVRGRYCITSSNVAKFDAMHGLVIFDEPHPLRFTREQVCDYFETARRWLMRAHEARPAATYPLVVWNCLWRAGASLIHGHLQVLLGESRHYPVVERLRRDARMYAEDSGRSYFEDLFSAHAALGAGFELGGVRIMANVAPVKEREVILLSDEWDDALEQAIADVLAYLRDREGTASFNLALAAPPMGEPEAAWRDFPIVVHILDRGSLRTRTADVAGMELYAASVVSSDPLQ